MYFSNPCQNGGLCVPGSGLFGFVCYCIHGYGGDTCVQQVGDVILYCVIILDSGVFVEIILNCDVVGDVLLDHIRL